MFHSEYSISSMLLFFLKDELHKYQYETLPGTLYFRSNCLAECRQKQMVANCNCTIDFLYPTADYPICNISNFKCLYNYDSKYTQMFQNCDLNVFVFKC